MKKAKVAEFNRAVELTVKSMMRMIDERDQLKGVKRRSADYQARRQQFKSRWGISVDELNRRSIFQTVGEWVANLSKAETGILVSLGHGIIELDNVFGR